MLRLPGTGVKMEPGQRVGGYLSARGGCSDYPAISRPREFGLMILAAAIVCLAALVVYIRASIWLAPYPAPWSASWHTTSQGFWPALGNAGLRIGTLACLALAIAWPYFQGRRSIVPNHVHPVVAPVFRPISGGLEVRWMLVVVGLAAFSALAWLVSDFVRRGRDERTEAATPSVVEPESPNLKTLTEEGLAIMTADPNVRRAILACYALMERRLVTLGLPRKPSETALEYAGRILEQAGAPQAPLRSLTGLFQVAGFSSHSMDEPMRQMAIGSLQAIGGGTE